MTNTTTAKTRNQSPVVARRKMMRSIVKRANVIAKNAYNVHNSSIDRIAAHGAATSKNEFLSIAMTIAWKEQKTGQEIYKIQGNIPRKSMQDIHKALKSKITQTNKDTQLTKSDRYHEQARTMILARNAGKHDESDMQLAYNIAYKSSDNLYALSA